MEFTLPELRKYLGPTNGYPEPQNSTSRRNYNRNESKNKKTQGEDFKEKPTWMKKNIKHEVSESKIRTWNDTEWNWCIKEAGGKCLGNWRIKTIRM